MPCCEDARLINCPPSSTVLYFNAWIHNTSSMFNLFSKVAMFLVSANQARICYVTAQITWFVVVLHCNVCFSSTLIWYLFWLTSPHFVSRNNNPERGCCLQWLQISIIFFLIFCFVFVHYMRFHLEKFIRQPNKWGTGLQRLQLCLSLLHSHFGAVVICSTNQTRKRKNFNTNQAGTTSTQNYFLILRVLSFLWHSRQKWRI